jgi:hypothetical protein
MMVTNSENGGNSERVGKVRNILKRTDIHEGFMSEIAVVPEISIGV